MDKVENAREKFVDGYACSQAIVVTYCEDFNLNRETALKLAAPFAGGMRLAGTCGAVTGALMIIGLNFTGDPAEKNDGRKKTYEAATKFMEAFTAMPGSTVCRELLAVDISTPEGHAEAKQKKLFRTVCPRFIEGSATILDEMLGLNSQNERHPT